MGNLLDLSESLAKAGHGAAAEALRAALKSCRAPLGETEPPSTAGRCAHASSAVADAKLAGPSASGTDVVRVGSDFSLCPRTMRISVPSGAFVSLTVRQMQIMFSFLDSEPGGVSRSQLVTRVWGKTRISPKCLNVHLALLRRKVAPIGLQIAHQAPDRYVVLLRGVAATISCE